MSGILVVVEERAGRVSRISWEALAAAQRLGGSSTFAVVVLGAETKTPSAKLASKVSGRVIQIEHPFLTPYTPDGYVIALQQLIQREKPAFVVFPHTYQVRDYAPALAARFGQVLISDVIAINEGPTFTRPLMQGRANGNYRNAGSEICFISVQAGSFPAEAAGAGGATTELFAPEIDAAQIRTHPGEPYCATAKTVDLGSAQIIVSVGRGIKTQDNLPLAQNLAAALGGEIAASRPICDAGWLPMERQVGSSGQTVAPKLYIAAGISGAIQHLIGMKGSQCIVAINKDASAPIFEVADYGIVGDLTEVLPALTEAVKEARK